MCRGNKVSGVVVVVVVVDFELIRIYFTDTFQWPSTSRLSATPATESSASRRRWPPWGSRWRGPWKAGLRRPSWGRQVLSWIPLWDVSRGVSSPWTVCPRTCPVDGLRSTASRRSRGRAACGSRTRFGLTEPAESWQSAFPVLSEAKISCLWHRFLDFNSARDISHLSATWLANFLRVWANNFPLISGPNI